MSVVGLARSARSRAGEATSLPGRCSNPTSPAGGQRGDIRFPGLRRSTAQWALDVEAVALRCGARGAGEPLHPDGEPSEKELGAMHWPQRAWWDDRDRIGECPSL